MDDGNIVYQIERKLKHWMFQGFKECIAKVIGEDYYTGWEGLFFPNIATNLYLTQRNNPKDYRMIKRLLKKKFKLDITLYV